MINHVKISIAVVVVIRVLVSSVLFPSPLLLMLTFCMVCLVCPLSVFPTTRAAVQAASACSAPGAALLAGRVAAHAGGLLQGRREDPGPQGGLRLLGRRRGRR